MENIFFRKVLINSCLFISPSDKASPDRVLLAVSGGADSVSMLLAFHELKDRLRLSIFVVNVNHNIRPKQESLKDSLFVKKLCKSLNIPCYIEELEPQAVEKYAKTHNCGIEAAARELRYYCFDKVANIVSAHFIATAHTQNDFYETILMRLFQGGSGKSLQGIPKKRGKYIRPLLDVSRDEVLEYLLEKQVDYCNDLTNTSKKYLRNRIRLILIPALNQTFPNWKSGLDKTLSNITLENEFIQKSLQKSINLFYKEDNKSLEDCFSKIDTHKLFFPSKLFLSLDKVLKIRVILKGLNILQISHRIKQSFLSSVVELKIGQKCETGFCTIHIDMNKLLFCSPKDVSNSNIGYSIFVDKTGSFEYFFGQLNVFNTMDNNENMVMVADKNDSVGFGPFKLPFYVRTKLPGDRIEITKGKFKTLKKIINELKVNSGNKDLLPIIEEEGIITGLYGFPIGVKNRMHFINK